MKLTTSYEKSYSFYGLDSSYKFNSITNTGSNYYCTMKNKTGIYVFNSTFAFQERISSQLFFDVIYYDKNAACFYLTDANNPNYLYVYNQHFRFLQRVRLRMPKSYGAIRSIQTIHTSNRLYVIFEHVIGFLYLANPVIQEFKYLEASIVSFFVHSICDETCVSILMKQELYLYNELIDHTGIVVHSLPLSIKNDMKIYRISEDYLSQTPSFDVIYGIADNLYQAITIKTEMEEIVTESVTDYKEDIEIIEDIEPIEDTELHAAEVLDDINYEAELNDESKSENTDDTYR